MSLKNACGFLVCQACPAKSPVLWGAKPPVPLCAPRAASSRGEAKRRGVWRAKSPTEGSGERSRRTSARLARDDVYKRRDCHVTSFLAMTLKEPLNSQQKPHTHSQTTGEDRSRLTRPKCQRRIPPVKAFQHFDPRCYQSRWSWLSAGSDPHRTR